MIRRTHTTSTAQRKGVDRAFARFKSDNERIKMNHIKRLQMNAARTSVANPRCEICRFYLGGSCSQRGFRAVRANDYCVNFRATDAATLAFLNNKNNA